AGLGLRDDLGLLDVANEAVSTSRTALGCFNHRKGVNVNQPRTGTKTPDIVATKRDGMTIRWIDIDLVPPDSNPGVFFIGQDNDAAKTTRYGYVIFTDAFACSWGNHLAQAS